MKLKKLFLVLLPIIFFLLALFLKSSTGPYWLGANNDPSYIYLMNSLYLIDGISPIFVDHPGTTLEILGAVIIKTMHHGLSSKEILEHVLVNPEKYLSIINYFMLVFFTSILIFAGLYAFKKTGSVIFSVLMQSSAMLYLTLKSFSSGLCVLPIISNVNSETLLISFLLLMQIIIVKLIYDQMNKDILISCLFMSIFTALAFTTKATMLPFIIIPIFLIPKIRFKLLYLIIFAAVVYVVTLPIKEHYSDLFNFLSQIVTHKGKHGLGAKGLIEVSVFVGNLKYLISLNKFVSFVFGVGICAFIYIMLRRKMFLENYIIKKHFYFFCIMLFFSIAQFLAVAKSPEPHYVTPAVTMVGILLAFIFHIFNNKTGSKWIVKIFVVYLIIFCCFNVVSAIFYSKNLSKINKEKLEFSNHVYSNYNGCIIAGHYRSSSKPFALYFGEDCKGYQKLSSVLQKVYPRSLYFNRWDYDFHHFKDQVSFESLKGVSGCILLYGEKFDDSNSFIKVKEIEKSGSEYLYKIISDTKKEAVDNFLMAKIMEIKQSYKGAYFFAMKSKEFGYPPLRVDRYLDELKQKIEKQN